MKKIENILLLLFALLSVVACNKLDIPPMNIIQDKDVFAKESGITAYMASLYNDLPIEDFNFTRNGFHQLDSYPGLYTVTGEALLCPSNLSSSSPEGGWWQHWGYGTIRDVNYFLSNFPAYAHIFPTERANIWLGEAHFIRAYNYFAMVKRYGGVPIIIKVQNYPEQSIEQLSVPRDSEKAVYEFIGQELDSAIALLPVASPELGRVNKYVAYALKSRAMLYAGSIAQYGRIQLDGLLGIPASDAQKFYQASYDASVELAGHYSLYRKYNDKYENYWNLFLDDDSPENIFCEYYKYPEKTHSLDAQDIPHQMMGPDGYSSFVNPTLEFVEMFDDVNGNSGVLKVDDANGNPLRFNNTMDLFNNVEPRLRGTVILPGDGFKGESIEVYKGTYTTYPSGELFTATDANVLYQGKSVIGKSGMGNNEMTGTGFFNRKYQNPYMVGTVALWRSAQKYIDIRYGEILLNRAEAAFQLSKIDDALLAINDIRDRAGAKLLTQGQLTAKSIQKERRMELSFENQTYWDLRRWRIADTEMNNAQYRALCPYYVFDEGKFIFKKEPYGKKYTFDVKVNYVQIPTDQIFTNNKLIQNPGY